MANQPGNVSPKADQPRVSTDSLKRGEQPATLQYRTTGIKTSTGRTPRSTARYMGRG